MKRLVLVASHLVALALGFALGIYALPILIAPQAPSAGDIASIMGPTLWRTEFRRNLKDSDTLHWGEGAVSVGPRSISFIGKLAPGPDYKLYLSPEFVETKADFMRLKARMQRIGDVKTFENFLVLVPEGTDPAGFNTVIVWCESFGQFITAAKYK
ncbi:DM13 domain-containing protein [Aquabacterium sp.]|uniref:DM13 domain-containing protein n=1 Tax=Aquabacterium sp. TaxID=1872578 RepID=UPI002CD1EF88|nr:DM13 domain-containing protein [Aquabacterium sp.]HSW03929.1 DM13 domain-containing protein [Aquabacterium sp.]